jgi:hypothetical protein
MTLSLEDQLAERFKREKKVGTLFWRAIGEFVFRFGQLETKVDHALCLMIGIDYIRVGQFLLREMNFPTRVRLLRVFCRVRDAKIKADMKALIDAIETQNTYRNHLVHRGRTSSMIQEGKPDEWHKIGLNRKLRTSAVTFTAAEISLHAAKVNELSIDVIILAQKVAKMLPPDRASLPPF